VNRRCACRRIEAVHRFFQRRIIVSLYGTVNLVRVVEAIDVSAMPAYQKIYFQRRDNQEQPESDQHTRESHKPPLRRSRHEERRNRNSDRICHAVVSRTLPEQLRDFSKNDMPACLHESSATCGHFVHSLNASMENHCRNEPDICSRRYGVHQGRYLYHVYCTGKMRDSTRLPDIFFYTVFYVSADNLHSIYRGTTGCIWGAGLL
jgi:hypothetical protein